LPDDVAVQLDLYLPYCFSRPTGLAVAHIGQSLDGRIATENGESRWITGEADLLHCHRMRALADAVLVGARTVRVDDPQLTVRRCVGDNPFRVVIDPELSLTGRYKIFGDRAAPTLIVAAKEPGDRRDETHGCEILRVPRVAGTLDVSAIRVALRDRGLSVVLVEGGGITISRFLEAGCLDRLQITVAPMIIGAGRPGVAFPGGRPLDCALRPRVRRFDLGGDTLFDCDFDA
jgi:riboflavin-specific deaminase-like protein